MSCQACAEAQYVGPYDAPKSYYIRIGTGNLQVKGCRAHVAELIEKVRA